MTISNCKKTDHYCLYSRQPFAQLIIRDLVLKNKREMDRFGGLSAVSNPSWSRSIRDPWPQFGPLLFGLNGLNKQCVKFESQLPSHKYGAFFQVKPTSLTSQIRSNQIHFRNGGELVSQCSLATGAFQLKATFVPAMGKKNNRLRPVPPHSQPA